MEMHLSSLHFLEKEGDGSSRPQSRAFDSSSRPQSRSSPTNHKKNDDNAFKVFPDYSKYNADRHSAQRQDTFQSPSPTRKRGTTPAKVTGEDMTAINSAYLISGIRSDVREIGVEMNHDVQEQTQETLASMRAEVERLLTVVGDTRESTVNLVMEKLKTDIHKILSDAGWPLKVDFTPIREEYKEQETQRLWTYNRLMNEQNDRLSQLVTPIVDELPGWARFFGELQKEIRESHDDLREELRDMQQMLVTDVADVLRKVHSSQNQYFDKNSDLESRFEAQLVRNVKEKAVRVDFDEVMSAITHSTNEMCTNISFVQDDLKNIGEDVLHIGQSVSGLSAVDFANAAVGGKRTSVLRGVGSAEVDSNWTQTDEVAKEHTGVQTDDKFWKAKAGKGRLTANLSRTSSQKAKAQLQKQEMEKSTQAKKVFLDAEGMKKKARQALIKSHGSVFDFYKDKGMAQKIAKSNVFESVTFLIVGLNALWIAVDADHNDAPILIDAHPIFQVAENLFCTYFTWELITRFVAFKKKLNCLKDAWFVFDLALVALMVFETWVMSIAFLAMGTGADLLDASMLRLVRLVKILRLSRLARLMRAVPEIIIFVKGIGAASRSVFSLFALWLIIIYIFAVFFVQTLSGEAKETTFASVPKGMNTLLLEGIFPDNSPLVQIIADSNPIFWPIIVGFVLFASITLSYMLIGVLVQIVQVIASTEKEKALVGIVIQQLSGSWREAGHSMEDHLSREQFQSMLVDPSIAQFCNGLGVDVLVLVDMSDMVYDDVARDSTGVNFENFIDIILNMRGGNAVTVKDIKGQQRVFKRVMKDSMESFDAALKKKLAMTTKEIVTKVRAVVAGEDESGDDESGFPSIMGDGDDVVPLRADEEMDEDEDDRQLS